MSKNTENDMYHRFDKLRPLIGADEDDPRANLALHFLTDSVTGKLDEPQVNTIKKIQKYGELNYKNWNLNKHSGELKISDKDDNWLLFLIYIGSLAESFVDYTKISRNMDKIMKIAKTLDTNATSWSDESHRELFELFRSNPYFANRIYKYIKNNFNLKAKKGSKNISTRGELSTVTFIELKDTNAASFNDTALGRYVRKLIVAITEPPSATNGSGGSIYRKLMTLDFTAADTSSASYSGPIRMFPAYKDIPLKYINFDGYKLCKANIREILERTINSVDDLALSGIFSGDSDTVPNITLKKLGNEWVNENGSVVKWDLDSCCDVLGTSGNPTGQCTNYLTKCLVGKDVDECQKFMADEGFWANSINDAKNIHPSLLLKTLEAFKIKTVMHGNQAMVESIETWAARTNSETKITVAQSLKDWLQIIADIYNSNSHVRNSNSSNAFNGTKWQQWGILPKVDVSSGNVASLMGVINNTANMTSHGYLGGLPGMIHSGSQFANKKEVHVGGGIGDGPTQESVESVESTLGTLAHLISKDKAAELETVWHGLRVKLQSLGKKLGHKDENHITKLLSGFKDTEHKLKTSLLLADKYCDLLSIGEHDNNSEVNVSHLTDFVNKNVRERATKLERQATNLGSIFVTLQKTLSQQGGATIVPPINYKKN